MCVLGGLESSWVRGRCLRRRRRPQRCGEATRESSRARSASRVETFGTAQEFLQSPRAGGARAASCSTCAARVERSRSAARARRARASSIPIVFITGHGDVPMSVQAMKAGAVEFLTKPFRDQQLLDAVQQAIERDRVRAAAATDGRGARASDYESLTPREREVMTRWSRASSTSRSPCELGTSEITVKVHRGRADAGRCGRSPGQNWWRMAERSGAPEPGG